MAEIYNVGPRRLWKAEEFDNRKPTVYDWVRMAAFIDGEGHVQVNPGRTRMGTPKHEVRILVSNTNPIMALWMKQVFGGNICSRDFHNPKWKVQYVWSCTAARAGWILYNCLPWFLLKKTQAEILIELQEHKDLTRQGRGRRISEAAVEYRTDIHERIKMLNAKGPSKE